MPQPTTTLLYPTAESWAALRVDEKSENPTTEPIDDPADLDGAQGPIVAIPAKYLYSLPLHFLGNDHALLDDVVQLQVDKRGLLATTEEVPVYHAETIISGENSALIATTLLDSSYPDSLSLRQASRFEPSPYLYKFPPNQITLYAETDALVMVVTRGLDVAYFHVLGESTLTPETFTEIHCTLLQLIQERVIDSILGITFWVESDPKAATSLGETLGVPVHHTPQPLPEVPSSQHDITPMTVRAARMARTRAKRLSRVLTGLAALYLLLVGFLGYKIFRLESVANNLRAEVEQHAPDVTRIKQAAQHWEALTIATDRDAYPVERLLRVAKLLPPQGVRLVTFEQRGSDFLIAGEATNAPAAVRFNQSLKRSVDWAGYTWTMPAPRLLPNNSAKFQITGRRVAPGEVSATGSIASSGGGN